MVAFIARLLPILLIFLMACAPGTAAPAATKAPSAPQSTAQSQAPALQKAEQAIKAPSDTRQKAAAAKQATTTVWKPSGNIHMIVASGAGTAYDLMARKMNEFAPKYLGVQMIVENLPGGGGRTGADRVAKAKPDGLTVGFMSNSAYTGLQTHETFSWNAEDLPFILGIDVPPYGVYAGTSSPFSSWEDVRNYKEKLRISNVQNISTVIPAIVDLREHNVNVAVAQFGGTPEAHLAVFSGDAHLFVGAASGVNMQAIQENKFRPLLVFADKRYGDLPDTPTHEELGMPSEWKDHRASRILFAPLETPPEILEGLQEGFSALLRDPEMVQWGKQADFPTDLLEADVLRQRLSHNLELLQKYDDLVKQYGG